MSKKTFKLEAEFYIEESSNDVYSVIKEYKDHGCIESDKFRSPLSNVTIEEIETKKYGKTKDGVKTLMARAEKEGNLQYAGVFELILKEFDA